MSLDYPNREDWLAVRNTRPTPWREVFLSVTRDGKSHTYATGATRRKDRTWDRKRHNKLLRRKLKREVA